MATNEKNGERPVVGMYAFRTPDPRRLAAFWADVMDLPVSELSNDELVMLDFDHVVAPVTWMFHRDESAGAQPSRIGLDIGAGGDGEGWHELADRAERAGARRDGEFEVDRVRWIEMADPDGNAFRVFGPRPA